MMRRASLSSDRKGTALVEFALVLPFLVLLFIGGFQLMDAVSAYRKVGTTVRTLADLTTQNTTLTTAQADQILNASRQVMSPYSTTQAVLRITQIKVQANGQPIVSWSRALNGSAYTVGDAVTMPANLKIANTWYIYSEMSYTYQPNVGTGMIGAIPLKRDMYMSPRNSSSIVYN